MLAVSVRRCASLSAEKRKINKGTLVRAREIGPLLDGWDRFGIKQVSGSQKRHRLIYLAQDCVHESVIGSVCSNQAPRKDREFPRGDIAPSDETLVVNHRHGYQYLHAGTLAPSSTVHNRTSLPRKASDGSGKEDQLRMVDNPGCADPLREADGLPPLLLQDHQSPRARNSKEVTTRRLTLQSKSTSTLARRQDSNPAPFAWCASTTFSLVSRLAISV